MTKKPRFISIEMMKPFRLMHLFRHISEKTTCPQCHARIFPENIAVDNSSDESAFLTISCPSCKQDLHAHVFVNFSNPEIAKDVEERQGEITAEEVNKAHSLLENYRSEGFDDLFSNKS